jgi:hypothetical protein
MLISHFKSLKVKLRPSENLFPEAVTTLKVCLLSTDIFTLTLLMYLFINYV